MGATVAGLFRAGKLELLEQPSGVPEGRVRVTIEQDTQGANTILPSRSRELLRLPLGERRRLLAEQAARLEDHYQKDGEWREWLAGDLVDY